MIDQSAYTGGPVIFGGGGGFYPDVFDVMVRAKDRPRVVWGMGTNLEYRHAAVYPHWLAEWNLVGVRDYGSPFEYVPCPSCLSPLFDEYRVKSPECPVVSYEHHCYPICLENAPNLVNCCGTLEDALRHLARGETVVTNSYHGAYWAFLLGRKVIGWRLWSNKFRTLKYPVPNMEQPHTWPEASKPEADYLQECRERNHIFAAKVRQLLASL